MKALARKTEDRYQSATDLQNDVQAYLDGFATSAEDASTYRIRLAGGDLLRRRTVRRRTKDCSLVAAHRWSVATA